MNLYTQSADRHITLLGHIILIPRLPAVFAPSPECCVLSGETTNTNFIVFGLTRSGLKPMIYHNTANAVNKRGV